jgi:hypothetical protein
MEFTKYVRRPFTVEAVIITEENMEEIAKLVGDIRTEEGTTFIRLDRRIVPNINRAFAGWYLTKLGDNYRCYSPKVFLEQFVLPDQTDIPQAVVTEEAPDA